MRIRAEDILAIDQRFGRMSWTQRQALGIHQQTWYAMNDEMAAFLAQELNKQLATPAGGVPR